jgi:hypothetical protein
VARSWELKRGSRVPIPCRICSQKMIAFEVKEGVWGVECRACRKVTEILVEWREGRLQIRTWPAR